MRIGHVGIVAKLGGKDMRDSTAELLGIVDRYIEGVLSLDQLYAITAVLDAGEREEPDDWEEAVEDVWRVLHAVYAEGLSDQKAATQLAAIRRRLFGRVQVRAGFRPIAATANSGTSIGCRVTSRFNPLLIFEPTNFAPMINQRLPASQGV